MSSFAGKILARALHSLLMEGLKYQVSMKFQRLLTGDRKKQFSACCCMYN